MTGQQLGWIDDAIEIVKRGTTNKVISKDKMIQVYKCGAVIRVDIKEEM